MVGNEHRDNRLRRLIFVGIVVLSATQLFTACKEAPTKLARTTWEKIQSVKEDGEESTPALAVLAQARYDSAWQVIERENRRWPFMRNFAPAKSLFLEAAKLADSVSRIAGYEQQQHKSQLGEQIQRLDEEFAQVRERAIGSLGRLSLQQALTAAELKLAVAKRELANGSRKRTAARADEAAMAIAHLQELVEREQLTARQQRALSAHWIEQTVEWSLNTGRRALIVIKSKHQAILVDQGVEMGTFDVDIGYNAGARKLHSGDAATPEGIYEIVNKRENGSSFYKSLDLNYPNPEDRRRFNLALEAGRIPYGTGIGDAIGVHGDGGVGEDWTDGCVALSNDDMDRLMAAMSVGDRVTIVRHTDLW